MDPRYTDEVEHRYGAIRCPVRILWGEDDEWIPIAQGRALGARIPNAVFQSVQDAGHLVQEDAPEAVVATLLGVIGSD
jgi:pimeloyl-ACP methyl ester carboxylesterase